MMYRGIVALFMFVYFPSMALHVVKYKYSNHYKNSRFRDNYRRMVRWSAESPSDVNVHDEWKPDADDMADTEVEDFDELDEDEIKFILGKYNKMWMDYYDEFYSKKAFVRRHRKRLRIWKRWDKNIDEYKRTINKIKKGKPVCWD